MADEPTPSDAPEEPSEPEATVETPEPAEPTLGDAGKAAIKAERQRAAKAEREAKELRARLEAIEAENLTESEKAIAAARDEGRAEAMTSANERLLRAEVKAAAAGKLSDPADALALLDLSGFSVGDDGEVDPEAIESAIDALVDQKPYLAAGAKPGPTGTGGGGARPSTTPESIDQRIRAAEKSGDHRTALSLKNRGLAAALLTNT